MKTFYILGVDQSTQGTKAVLFDETGKRVERCDLPHKQIINNKNWVSHDPEEIYRNVVAVCRHVIEKAGIDKNQIACMGIDNQRETTVGWDRKTGQPVGNAIVWQCSRAKDLCNRISMDSTAGDEIYRKTGLKLSPYYPAAKMAWMIEHFPGMKEKIKSHTLALGTVDSWVIYKLTHGISFKTDYSNASRTQLFNIRELTWDKGLCHRFGIPEDTLPEVCDSDSVFGNTDLEGYLERPIPICGVLGDSHGALFGHNCRNEGDIKATYGTGSSVMLNTGFEPFFSKQGLSTSLAWKVNGKVSYVLEGNINYTGAVMSWLKDKLGMLQSTSEISRLSSEADPNDQTYIVPAFSGLGAPWWRDDTRAAITGISRMTGRKEIIKAASECSAYQINDIIEAMRKDTSLNISQMCVDGGPTRDKYLMQFQSNITDIGVRIPNAEELSVIGTAYLAGISAGLYDENNVYNAISYNLYHPKMDSNVREEKIFGWNKAIKMLLGE
ncbi:MAG: glycerol kinase GlpK [Oscillospiraceae bacterium]|nr:glycerol kinase GlpK [Oscillospiraceae bacterium]